MLFDYTASTLPSGRTGTFWSRFPLLPIAPGVVTPFSYSVLAELVGRSWFIYYDRLGFDPTPRSKVVRQYKGHAYFNLALGAKLESEQAGVEPLPLRVNGQPLALAAWEKPGFLAGFKVGRAQKRIEETWLDAAKQMGATTEKARAWYLKTQSIRRWGQAEVLQIMEEIERIGIDSMTAFLAARLNLGQLYARLMADLGQANISTPRAALLVANAVGTPSGLVETSLLDALAPMVNVLRDPQQLEWLKNSTAVDWHRFAPDDRIVSADMREGVKNFIDQYGHRTLQEGEMANLRWAEDARVLRLTLLSEAAQTYSAKGATYQVQPLLNALPAATRKQGEQSLKQIGELLKLQSQALNAFAYVLGGTRTWALSAAREAMVDKRLHAPTEAFLLELEEIKQLMTGEWNISSLDEIRALIAKRQVEYDVLRDTMANESAPDALAGDEPLFLAGPALPGVSGHATGPLAQGTTLDAQAAIVAAPHLDSGYTLALSSKAGFVGTAGTPFDPFVVAAQSWQHPVAIGLGAKYADLSASDAPTTLEVSADGVTIR